MRRAAEDSGSAQAARRRAVRAAVGAAVVASFVAGRTSVRADSGATDPGLPPAATPSKAAAGDAGTGRTAVSRPSAATRDPGETAEAVAAPPADGSPSAVTRRVPERGGSPIDPPMLRDQRLLMRLETVLGRDGPAAAFAEFLAILERDGVSDRRLEVSARLPHDHPRLLGLGRLLLREVAAAAFRASRAGAGADGSDVPDALAAAQQQAVELAARATGSADAWFDLLEELDVETCPAALRRAIAVLTTLSRLHAGKVLRAVAGRDPALHDELLAAWCAAHPDESPPSRPGAASSAQEKIAEAREGFAGGDVSRASELVWRLHEAGRMQEAVEVVREAARRDAAEAFRLVERLPPAEQDALLAAFSDADLREWMEQQGWLHDELRTWSPAWGDRLALLRLDQLDGWSRDPRGPEPQFAEVVGLLQETRGRVESPVAPSLLERASVFGTGELTTPELEDGMEQATWAFRIGERGLAIRWAQRLVDAARRLGGDDRHAADRAAEFAVRLQRMRRGVDPEPVSFF